MLAVLLFASPGGAQDGMQWSTGIRSDGDRSAYLTFGIPETDAVRFSAACGAGSPRETAPALLAYDTGNLREGARVNVQFFAGGQQVYQKPARVHGTRSEVGASGVRFGPSYHDHFWQVLSRGGSLSYAIAGRAPSTINLDGAAGPIARFTQACKTIHAAPVAQAGGGTAHARSVSCDNFGRLKSVDSKVPLTLTFTNRTGSYRGVLWLDYQGKAVDYAGLNSGQSYVQQTFAGHPWMFTDGPGDCKEIYVPQAGDTRFDITAE